MVLSGLAHHKLKHGNGVGHWEFHPLGNAFYKPYLCRACKENAPPTQNTLRHKEISSLVNKTILVATTHTL